MFMLWLDQTQLTGQFKEPPHNNQYRHMAGSRKEEGWEEQGAARLMKLHPQNCVTAKPHTHILVSELYCGFQRSLKCLQNNVFRVGFQWEKENHFFGLLCKVCSFQKWMQRLPRSPAQGIFHNTRIQQPASRLGGAQSPGQPLCKAWEQKLSMKVVNNFPAQKVMPDQNGKEIQSSFANS